MNLKFNIYDNLGYILVGVYQIIFIYALVLFIKGKPLDASLLNLNWSISVLLFSYFIGHLVQATSNFVEDIVITKIIKSVFKKAKSEEDKKGESDNDLGFITEKAREYFELPKDIKQKYIFQYCYLFALSNDFSGHVALFNSMYSLYRGFFISSLLNLIGYIAVLLSALLFNTTPLLKTNILFYVTVILLFLFTWLFYNRKDRFFKYMGDKTLITYDILSKGKISK